ncbi:RTA1-domain-containing protein [Hyaloscypha variabilis F]|uniref:RTA1-domain-containing protein n=1 Tax=Hyaloscypha variabilis (strain UAMH 11265 / GT02V1 / F) TaxID=1149755 RepID=A0A2J6RJL0_HYAVF|nr:RTA1-domain-containing protein [Hyaloscypha variabilis F]
MADMTCKQVGPDCPLDGSSLGYAPNIGASAVFTVLFSLSYVCHLTLGWKYKTWTFMIAMLLGSTSEVVGYIGRILMHNNPYRLSTFLTQIVCLTTAPAFYSAGIYLCLSRIVLAYGEGISRIQPVWYTRFFITCDIISLSLQGGGGGVASSATTTSTMDLGNHLMLAGLIFQIVSLLLFATACLDFTIRVHRYPSWKNPAYKTLRSSTRFRGFLWALVVAFSTIFTRCVYRVIELGGGWNNRLMREEKPFIVLESCMITVAVFALVLFHPGFGFQNKFNDLEYEDVSATGTTGTSKEAVSLMVAVPDQATE